MPSIGMPDNIKPPAASQAKMVNQENISSDLIEKLAPKRNVDGRKTDPSKLDKDDFLKMLGAQMKNQDPSQPADQEKFTTTMAQFAQLEQLTQLNKNFSQSLGDDREQLVLKASSLVGKRVVLGQNSVEVKDPGSEQKIYFSLEKPMKQGKVTITDSTGALKSVIPVESLGKGEHFINWNGRNADGTPAEKGAYRIQVQGIDDQGSALTASTKISGQVESAFIQGKEVLLQVAGHKINLRDIEQIAQ